MPRSSLALGFALVLSLAGCAAYRAQHQAAQPAAGGHEAVSVAVRPSGEFSELRPDLQITRVQGELDAIKTHLSHQGRYSCCVDPPCTECLFKYGQCLCREMVRHGRAACGECNQAWIDGKGIVEGVDARELLKRSEKLLETSPQGAEGEKPPEHHHP